MSHYEGTFGATEEHADGKSVLVASTVPLRVRGGSGQLSPVSLSLKEESGVLAPRNPIVPVSISRDASRGVSLPGGVSVIAAGASGSQPTVVGDRAVWPGSSPDSDLLVEPLPLGVDVAWQLRSEHSPQENSLVFALAAGDSLQMSVSEPGSAEVVRGGQRVLLVPPASAQQANGEPLAVSYTVSGDVLTTHVNLEGNVDFPVLLDPSLVVVGHYGEEGKGWQNEFANTWHISENCACFAWGPFRGSGEGLWRSKSPPWGESWGDWWVNPDEGAFVHITRVDVSGLTNTVSENTLEAGIYEAGSFNAGGKGTYTFNTGSGPIEKAPLLFSQANGGAHEGKSVAFCAYGGNGKGAELCDEEIGGNGFAFGMYKQSAGGTNTGTDGLESAQLRFIQSTPPSASLEIVKRWFNSQREGSVTVHGEDMGTGIAEVAVSAEPTTERTGSGHEIKEPQYHVVPGTSRFTANCPNAFCPKWATVPYNLSELGTGIWDVVGWSRDAVGLEHQEAHLGLIDNTPPEIQTPSWSGATLNDATHELAFTAQDGSESAPQSGVDKLTLEVDGRRLYERTALQAGCPNPEGKVPTSGCFGLAGEYTLDGESLAAGEHAVTIRAEDWVGNQSVKSLHITIVDPVGQSQQVGPGTLNLQSGDYKLSAGDVSISAAGGADLSVSRSFDAQSSGSAALGPGWTLSTPDASAAGQWQTLEPLPNGNVEATTTGARKVMFTASGEGYTSPTGFQTYTLKKISATPAIYQILDAAGDYTQFEVPAGGSGFMPSKVGQSVSSGGLNAVTYVIQEGETSEIVGPEPAGVSCKEKRLETRGCRVLVLKYATGTSSEIGEGASEWGAYAKRLESISLNAWDPARGKMTSTAAARYAYDKKGRLRAEWDPRIAPALKTTYGYDPEGDLTAVTPAGQQPYLMHYGTSTAGVGAKWLLSVTRPGAETEFGDGSAPVSTVAPKLSSTSPVVGTSLKVSSTGKWSNTPLAYTYLWEDCNAAGGECAPIAGATNQSYTPQQTDISHTLVALLEAQNAFGGEVAPTVASGVVPSGSSSNNPIPAAPKTGTSAVTTIEYRVPTTGSGAPNAMGATETAGWGQTDPPAEATAIFPPDEPAGWPTGGYQRASVYYFDSYGRRVNVATPGGAISTTQYESHDNINWSLTPDNRQKAIEAGVESKATANKLATESNYGSEGTELESSVGPQHEVKLGSEAVTARAFTHYYYDEGAPGTGGPYRLVTNTEEGAQVESGKEAGRKADVRTIKDSYSGQENLGWKLHKPTAVTTELEPGKTSTRKTSYEASTGDVTETTTPAGANEGTSPHTAQTIYYTAGANTNYPACGGHAEWANLPCQSQPAAQPGNSLPKLPVTVTTYNTLDQSVTVKSTVGTSTRSASTTYDEAGRTLTSSITSSTGKTLPTVTDEYNKATGQLETQSTTEGTITKTLKSVSNTLGQPTAYTDAGGVTSTYAHDIDGRITEAFDGKGTQTNTYDTTTGALKTLTDSAAGKFSVTRDTEGNIETETDPNGMKASYTYNPTGERVALTYSKGSKWYEDTVVPSIHGQWISQTTTLAADTYAYDKAGRMTEDNETPRGKGCTTHLYSYNEDSSRTSETTRESSTSTCATTGGSTATHSYDNADRLTDPGTQYETFGADTTLPATDAGGHELQSSYYADGTLYSQTQNEQTNTYSLDPAGRVLETTTATKSGAMNTISHYTGSSATPAWSEQSTGSFSRKISGIDGSLAAIQTSSTEVTIQLSNLHGDIIGTAPDTSEAKPTLIASEPTAFGVPTSPQASKSGFGWLGAGGLQIEFESGIAASSSGSYVPQLGIHLAPEALSPSTQQDPTNEYLSNRTLAQPNAGYNGESPNAIHPAPVNTKILEEFWANPPWNKPPATTCQYRPGCEDPSILLTSRQAFLLAVGLRNGGSILELAADHIPGAGIFIKVLVTLSGDISTELAEGLEDCYTLINQISANARCKPYIDLFADVLPEEWGVETCFAKAHTLGEQIDYTYPYCVKL